MVILGNVVGEPALAAAACACFASSPVADPVVGVAPSADVPADEPHAVSPIADAAQSAAILMRGCRMV
jgi:hypothetical protein